MAFGTACTFTGMALTVVNVWTDIYGGLHKLDRHLGSDSPFDVDLEHYYSVYSF